MNLQPTNSDIYSLLFYTAVIVLAAFAYLSARASNYLHSSSRRNRRRVTK